MNTISKLILATIAVTSFVAVAADSDHTARTNVLDKIINERFGGMIQQPGSGTGATGFVNIHESASQADIDTVIKTISTQLKHQQKSLSLKELKDLPSRKIVEGLGLNAAVFVVSDEHLPVMLTAPEDRWALVNVHQLKTGLKDDVLGKRLLSVRVRGELQRAFAYVCGGGSSQYDGNLMNITEVNQLDQINPDMTIADTTARCRKYLESIKVTPKIMRHYSRAVKEGWAPAPTNDAQRAVWERVKAEKERGPTNAIQIKP